MQSVTLYEIFALIWKLIETAEDSPCGALSASAEMYSLAERVTEKFIAVTGEPIHLTCTSYVEVVRTYLSLFAQKKHSLGGYN